MWLSNRLVFALDLVEHRFKNSDQGIRFSLRAFASLR